MDKIKPSKNPELRGQASLEQIILIAVLLAFITAVFVLAANYSANTTGILQAQDTVDQLTAAADFVYALGPNSEEYVTVYLPNSMVSWNITGKSIKLTMQTSAGSTDVFSYSKANLVGALPAFSGTQKVLVEYLPSGVVRIGAGSLYCSPPTISRGFTAGNSSSDTITISNIGSNNVTGMSAVLSGGGGSLTSIGDVLPSGLAPGQNATLAVNYNIPSSAAGGVYGAMVTVSSSGGDSCSSQITLSVNSQSTCQAQCCLIGYVNGTCRASPSQCIIHAEDYRPEKDSACGGTPSTPDCCCTPTSDRWGPLANIGTCIVANNSISVQGMCNDTSEGNGYIANAQMQIDFGDWVQAYPSDGGSFNSSSTLNVSATFTNLNLLAGVHVVGLRCFDTSNNTGFIAYTNFSIATNYTIINITQNETTCSMPAIGPIITGIWQMPTPAQKYQPLAIFATANDSGNSTITNCTIDADNADSWRMMEPVNSTYNQTNETVMYNYTAGFSVGPHTIRIRCVDAANVTGPTAYYYFNVTEADILGPIVMNVSHTPYPTTMSNISVSATVTDIYTGNSDIQDCQVKVGAGPWVNASAADGAYDSPTEDVAYNLGPVSTGFHTISWQCTDALGNVGGVYNDSFGVVDVDVMLVIDKSGSMADNVTNVANSNVVSAASTGWSWVKNLTINATNGNRANVTTEIEASATKCMVSYNITINGIMVAAGNQTSTSYVKMMNSIDISAFSPPFQVALWLKRNASGCTAYNQLFSVQQSPTKMYAAQTSAKTFIGIVNSATKAGLVSFSTSASTGKTLASMGPANATALDSAIDAIAATGSTCIECGLDNGVNELISSRGRPTANRIIIMLTDGMSNSGSSINGAVLARNNNVTVYTIGFGGDVNDTELTNVALLTYGDYYFAPNAETLTQIFLNIGK